MGEMEAYTTKLPSNTAEWFEDYVEREDVTRAAALRQLVERKRRQEEMVEELAELGVTVEIDDEEEDDSIETRANQAQLLGVDELTLLVSALTLVLVFAVVVGV